MAKQLTAASVARLKPGKLRREIPDGGCAGLFLIIQPSGYKSWALRFRRPGGRPAKLTLGPVDLSDREFDGAPVVGAPLTLAAAHVLAADCKRERARGVDLVAVNRRKKLEREAGKADTFAQAAVDFIEQHAMRKTRRWHAQARLLGLRVATEGGLESIPRGLTDRWADRPIAEIDGDDIHAIVDEVRQKGAPGLKRRAAGPTEGFAKLMFATLSKLFSWLVEKRKLRQNPCVGVASPKPSKSRERILDGIEIVKFWKACDKVGEPFGQVLKLLLLTGCRLNEVAGMTRAELNGDGLTWTIPGERTKNHRVHIIPLPALARDILESVATEGDIVFTTNGRAPASGWSRVKRQLDAAMKMPPWRLHDLRRTAATGMAEIGIAPHIVEACLNHVSGARAGVAGVYNRAAYAAEKKAALERWAAHVQGLMASRLTNVVALRGAKP